MQNCGSYNILICPTDTYFLQTLAVMQSAILNCKRNVRFFILHSDWTNEHQEKTKKWISQYPENKVEFIRADNDIFTEFLPWKEHYQNYYKILSHQFLPNDVERVLYLDCDTIINKDIHNYYDMDFDDKYIIASTETLSKYRYDIRLKSGIQKVGVFNAGVMLINLNKFRNENITRQTYSDAVKEMKGEIYFADQGLLNYVFKDKVKIIPSYKYNHLMYQEGNKKRKLSFTYSDAFAMNEKDKNRFLVEPYRNEIFNESENETIIHFAGMNFPKPWECEIKFSNNKIYVTDIPNLNKTDLDFSTAERFYNLWWNTAQKLPSDIFIPLILESQKNYAVIEKQDLYNKLNLNRTALGFFYNMSLDCISSHKFESYMENLCSKRIAILKENDRAGKFLKKASDIYNAEIVFSTPKEKPEDLTNEEWSICKTADVIICCSVYGTKPVMRDGIETIVISDLIE